MVFTHRCLPLSVSLREVKTTGATRLNTDKQFQHLLACIHESLNSDNPEALDCAWDYDYETLFFEGLGKRQKWLFPHLPPNLQVKFLAERTYWYSRLKKNTRRMVDNLLFEEKVLHLKEILHTVDGVMCQLITSFPELLMTVDGQHGYAHADRIQNNIIANCLFNYSRVVKGIKAFRKDLKQRDALG